MLSLPQRLKRHANTRGIFLKLYTHANQCTNLKLKSCYPFRGFFRIKIVCQSDLLCDTNSYECMHLSPKTSTLKFFSMRSANSCWKWSGAIGKYCIHSHLPSPSVWISREMLESVRTCHIQQLIREKCAVNTAVQTSMTHKNFQRLCDTRTIFHFAQTKKALCSLKFHQGARDTPAAPLFSPLHKCAHVHENTAENQEIRHCLGCVGTRTED